MKVLLQIILYIFLICTVFILFTSKRSLFGIKSFTVLTDSMKPTISSGSLIVIHENQNYKKGDVITYKSGSVEITHRIFVIHKKGNDILYRTKGDANKTPDISPVFHKNILGKVIVVLPLVGKGAEFLKTIPGLFLFILFPGIIFIILECRAIHNELGVVVVILFYTVSSLFVISNSITISSVNDLAVSSENIFSAASSQAQEPIADHIVISEVQTSGTLASQDFIELYNPTSQTINLSGWRIRKKTSAGTVSTLAAITSGKSISPYSFFLWSNSANGYDVSIGADISNTNTLSDNNSIELQDASAASIDQLGWGTGISQFFEGSIISSNPLTLHSLERKARLSSTTIDMMTGGNDAAAGNGLDTNNNFSDFIIRSQSEPQNSLSAAESL